MDDSIVNPMKTGLMFVPLGQVMPLHRPAPSRGLDRPADLEAVTGRAAHASRPLALRRLLERLWQTPRRHLPSPT